MKRVSKMSEKFTIVKRGYDISEVDQYITQLETVIRGYKEKDNAINNALVSAQITAGNIIKDANESASSMKSEAIAKLDAITASITVQKRMVKEFQDEYNTLVHKYLQEINETEILGLYSRVQDLEEYIDGLAADDSPYQTEGSPESGDGQSSWL